MKMSAINPITGEEIRKNYYNTYISYGLNEAEKERLREIEKNSKESRKCYKNISEIFYVECEDFTDVLAIPASLILIRFSALSDEELKMFNECFKETHNAIFAMDEFPKEADFFYFENQDILDEEKLDWAYMMRVLIMMEKRDLMFSPPDIEISSKERYTALDVYIKDDDLWYDLRRVKNGKVQNKEYFTTKDLEEAKNWCKGTTVVVWHRKKSYEEDGVGKTLDKIEFSDKLIDLYLFSGSEFPYLATVQEVKIRLECTYGKCDGMSKCDMIAYLLAIIIYYRENEEMI